MYVRSETVCLQGYHKANPGDIFMQLPMEMDLKWEKKKKEKLISPIKVELKKGSEGGEGNLCIGSESIFPRKSSWY